MKQVLNNVALGKKIDVVFQVVAFLVMIVAVTQTSYGPFGLYVMAIAQCFSCVLWVFFLAGDTPKHPAGTYIRAIFLIILGITLLALLRLQDAFMIVSYILLLVGPFLGIAYFITTIVEINFYQKVRKPYYLL